MPQMWKEQPHKIILQGMESSLLPLQEPATHIPLLYLYTQSHFNLKWQNLRHCQHIRLRWVKPANPFTKFAPKPEEEEVTEPRQAEE